MISEPITKQSVDTYLAGVFREDAGRVLSALIAQLRDFDLAEEALQDAVTAGLTAWRRDGVPENGAAWLLTAARRKAIDRLRRIAVRAAPENVQAIVDELEQSVAEPEDEQDIPDERLRLIFTCCNPALNQAAQVALTLRTLCGLSTREIARAFLVPEPTLAQRLVRAKAKISKAGIPYNVPEARHLAERLQAVLATVYLIFNEGYAATDGDSPTRADLCEEAIRLGRLLVALTPEAEAGGLLALMLLHDSRRSARHDADGGMIALDAQDRRQWDKVRIEEGTRLLRASLGRNRPGPYQVQAAISALHAEADDFDSTDWLQIAGLYAALEQISPSPVVTLNRAVAVSHYGSVDEALVLLQTIELALEGYQPMLAAKADFLRRLGRVVAARAAYREALALTTNAAERGFLEKQLDTLGSN
ncbi:MAG: RNA polymerase sigma-70 factor (ECF subfamily) [Paracoccaceae bacterium]|jgi:RNA polymerase sigma-70 factor (ECF subfamily)